jgi:hypothetical protein
MAILLARTVAQLPRRGRDEGSASTPHARLAARRDRIERRRIAKHAGARRSDRIFRDGCLLVERDHAALVARKARAVLDYLDFKPVEDRCIAGVLRAAAAGGR